jgi:septal ring factor EnvC (AmiA/AmiB activator)|tara:strand:- start:258 stop:533 length:276 start_codon:yes stop_codon:yes gene_type:complete
MTSTTNTKWLTPSFVATIVGWALTISIFIWNFSANHAEMEYRISSLEEKNSMLEQRMKDADALRTTIQTQLAEIKTDLIWIRNELSTRKED